MEYRRIGQSGLKVSEMGLGTNNLGGRTDEATSIDIINRALELGVNFIDTADLYSQGHSEEVVGKAVKGKRARVIIATKFGYPPTVGPSEQGGSRAFILRAVEASLKRLGTDYIDLYYFHHPDPATPIAETLRTLDGLVSSGKVRYIGCSNFAAWQLAEAVWTSRQFNLESFVAAQPRYNMLDRSIERELVPCCLAYGVGVVPWGPLGSGLLTGKYRRNQGAVTGGRLSANPSGIYRDLLSEASFARVEKLESFARERGHALGELAIAWLLAHPWLGSVIAGASSPDQLSANVAAANWRLTPEDMAQLEKLL